MHRRFQQPWFAVMQRQPDAEGRPSTHLAFYFDPSSVCPHDPLHDHQPQARAFLFRRVKWFEYAVNLFLWNSAACIGDTHPDVVGGFPRLYRQCAAFGHRLDGVFHQVDEYLLDLLGVNGSGR